MENRLNTIYGSDKSLLTLGHISIQCYLLEDGTRVLSGWGIQRLLLAPEYSRGTWLSKFFEREEIIEILSPELIKKMKNPVRFNKISQTGNKVATFGYEATSIVSLCEDIIEERISFQKIDNRLINQAETVVKAVAKEGIINLVDKATGYLYNRIREEIQIVIKGYISKELLLWEKKFPDSFYMEIFRLKGWDYNLKNIQKRQALIASLIVNLIYSKLPEWIIRELKEKAPLDRQMRKNNQYPQLLTEETGNSHLSHQVTAIVTLMRAAKNWNAFEKSYSRIFGPLANNIRGIELSSSEIYSRFKIMARPSEIILSEERQRLN